jgi:hypothetical protein
MQAASLKTPGYNIKAAECQGLSGCHHSVILRKNKAGCRLAYRAMRMEREQDMGAGVHKAGPGNSELWQAQAESC